MNRGRIILHSTLSFIFSSTFDMKGTWSHQSCPTAAFASNRLTVSVKSNKKAIKSTNCVSKGTKSYYLLIQNSTCLILHDSILGQFLTTKIDLLSGLSKHWTIKIYCVQGWAKEWSLGCVNSRPAARGSQEAGFTQPRDNSFAQLCIFSSKSCVKFML